MAWFVDIQRLGQDHIYLAIPRVTDSGVWKHWNSNGEYVTYVVPPGKPLKVWEGVTASQQLQEKSQFFLAGGARQIVIEPSDLDKAYMGKRQATGWGFSDGMTREPDFTGLPSLINNWRE